MTSYETLSVTKDDGIAWVSLDRPAVRNAVNKQMQAELRDVWTGFRYDDEVRCVVLTGEGDAFCTGIDRGGDIIVAIGFGSANGHKSGTFLHAARIEGNGGDSLIGGSVHLDDPASV